MTPVTPKTTVKNSLAPVSLGLDVWIFKQDDKMEKVYVLICKALAYSLCDFLLFKCD